MSNKYFTAPSSRFIDTLSSFEALLCSLTTLPHPSTHPHYPLALFQLLTLPHPTLPPPPPPPTNSPSIHPHRHPTPLCHPKTLCPLHLLYRVFVAFNVFYWPFNVFSWAFSASRSTFNAFSLPLSVFPSPFNVIFNSSPLPFNASRHTLMPFNV